MRRAITTFSALALTGMSMTSCLAGPHQLSRTVDDWDHAVYVESPVANGVLHIIPVIPLGKITATLFDVLITDMVSFWFHDAWDGRGTGYEYREVHAADGTLQSLLIEGSGWLRTR